MYIDMWLGECMFVWNGRPNLWADLCETWLMHKAGQILRVGGNSLVQTCRGENAKSNQYYQRPKGRVGRAYLAQQNKIAFLLIVYKVFPFIGVDHSDLKADRPSTGARRKAACFNIFYYAKFKVSIYYLTNFWKGSQCVSCSTIFQKAW